MVTSFGVLSLRTLVGLFINFTCCSGLLRAVGNSIISLVFLCFVSGNHSKSRDAITARAPMTVKGIRQWNFRSHFRTHGANIAPTRFVNSKNPIASVLKTRKYCCCKAIKFVKVSLQYSFRKCEFDCSHLLTKSLNWSSIPLIKFEVVATWFIPTRLKLDR